MGGDAHPRVLLAVPLISTHSARVGGDFMATPETLFSIKFQPTPPVWAETSPGQQRMAAVRIFQPTPPVWAETYRSKRPFQTVTISTHSARVGGDRPKNIRSAKSRHFNPLRPCGRRRGMDHLEVTAKYFNPLRPCGRRPVRGCSQFSDCIFQPTPPVWAETWI